MAEQFQGSIAQKNVQFPIETVVVPIAGENYSRTVIFIPVSLAETYLPGVISVEAGKLYEVKSSTYVSLTGGRLNSWLVPFFKKAASAVIGVAVYDDDAEPDESTLTMTKVFELFKTWGYFKMAVCADDDYNAAQVTLSTLCLAEPLYSQHWIGTWDANVLTATSAMISALNSAGSNSRVIYNPDQTINPALAQLGRTLSVINATGTPVGNSIDNVAFDTIEASGADGDNLIAASCTALDNQKIGYNTWDDGIGSGNVVTEGSMTLKGELCGANWVKSYIEFRCKVRVAQYITQMNTFRSNETYQGILGILSDEVTPFTGVDFGRLADFEITAPAFRDLPRSGDTFVITNAWHATYIDGVREVTVYGTLYVTTPTR